MSRYETTLLKNKYAGCSVIPESFSTKIVYVNINVLTFKICISRKFLWILKKLYEEKMDSCKCGTVDHQMQMRVLAYSIIWIFAIVCFQMCSYIFAFRKFSSKCLMNVKIIVWKIVILKYNYLYRQANRYLYFVHIQIGI